MLAQEPLDLLDEGLITLLEEAALRLGPVLLERVGQLGGRVVLDAGKEHPACSRHLLRSPVDHHRGGFAVEPPLHLGGSPAVVTIPGQEPLTKEARPRV